MITVNTFYKAKEKIDGAKTPKGYFYVTEVNGDTVKFAVVEEPDTALKTGNVFKMSLDDFRKFIEDGGSTNV